VPLIPQSVAGDVLMDFDSLKAAQSGLGTVRSGLYYVILTSSCCCLPCVPPWPVIICMNISHCIGSRTWMPLQAACPCRFSIAVDRVLKKEKRKAASAAGSGHRDGQEHRRRRCHRTVSTGLVATVVLRHCLAAGRDI